MFSKLKYLVLDVDGTLTDSGIYYDNNGNELKKFSTKDAAGIFAAKKIGIKIVVITGRECAATKRRMNDLKVDYLFQNVSDKDEFLINFMKENSISKEEIGYIGDDLNDCSAMKLCGFVGCPKNACQEILSISNCISELNGGEGAVRNIIEQMLRRENKWDSTIKDVYKIGI